MNKSQSEFKTSQNHGRKKDDRMQIDRCQVQAQLRVSQVHL